VTPFKFTTIVVSISGGSLIVSGIIGSIVFGIYLKNTSLYKNLIIISIAGHIATFIFFKKIYMLV